MVKEFNKEIKEKLIPEGEWQNEPDYQHWVDEETGLDCLIVRHNKSGHLCGYVGVPKTSRFYGTDYSDCTLKTARLRTEEEVKEATNFLNGISDPESGIELKTWPDGSLKQWSIERAKNKLICDEGYCGHTPESLFRVHGGITYSAECNGHVCHKTDNGDHVWWFGFDCAHSGDYAPNLWNVEFEKRFRESHPEFGDYHREDVYRNVEYVMQECKSLAKQIREYESKNTEFSAKAAT